MIQQYKKRIENSVCSFTRITFLTIFFFVVFSHNASAIIVDEIIVNGLSSITEKELLYLLDIHTGQTVDAEHVRLGIKRAFRKGIFEDISIQTVGETITKLVIQVTERNVIHDVDIEGDYAVSARTIKKLFPLKEGHSLRCNNLSRAEEHLKQELVIRGFPHTEVYTDIRQLKERYTIELTVHVMTGEPEIIERIKISGADESVKSAMKLSEGDVYDQILLEKDIERIREYFKRKKYYSPVIGPYSFNSGILNISVEPGKRLDISIEGNYAVSTKNLRKEMPFFEAEDFGDDIIQETVHRMLSVYHEEGYPFAQVAPVVTEKDHDIELVFFVFEGAEVEISSISFQGNTLEEENLKEVLSLKEGKPYNPDLIYADQELLQEYYRAIGYLAAHVDEFQTQFNESSQEMEIMISIREGLKTVLEHIEIEGAHLVPAEDVLKIIKLKRGDAYNEVDISDARFRILELYNTRGFPDARVAVSREIDGREASLVFEIEEGDQLFFGKTIIRGNNKTRYTVIQRELQNKEGQPYNYALLSRERQKLYKLGLFSDIDIEILDRYDHTQDILMKMQEGNAGSVEFGIGYADYERLRGSFDIGYRNLWGMNRQASLRTELSTLENRIITQFYEPWFLERPIPFRAFLLYEKKKEINIDTRDTRYRLKRVSALAGFEKKFTKYLKSELYYEFSVVKTYEVQPDVVLSKEDRGTLIISGIRPGIVYDTRDNPFYPKKGILTGLSTKITSPILLSETDFVKVSFYLNIYKEIMKRVVLATSFRGGLAYGYNDTDELPLVERYFLGGRNTVRGYDQDELGPKGADDDPTGGNAFLMENLELRISLGKGFGIVGFLDGGNVWIDIRDIDLSDFKFTTGLGLRYNTPVGPVRIDYGHKLEKERGESSGEIHFSIGHAF